jgi:2-methylisocitrate lyase-like PEP mutase family enzyme
MKEPRYKNIEKATKFHQLHQQEHPLILLNCWDAISAKGFENAGAPAVATTSAGIAWAMGYRDGEKIPLSLLFTIIERITQCVSIPVSVDFESGFATDNETLTNNIKKLLSLGVVGINIEDSFDERLIATEDQVKKISAIRETADTYGIPLFINARTDIYWLNCFDEKQQYWQTLHRLSAYRDAGADGIFVPGLTDSLVIENIATAIGLPVNVLSGTWLKEIKKTRGISRISTGSLPIRCFAPLYSQLGAEILSYGYTNFYELIEYHKVNSWFGNTC